MSTQETNRGTYNNVAPERVRWEVHYPAFQAGVEACLASVMCSYTGVNGDHSCENNWLLQGDLKDRMDFTGWVMSDWWAVKNMSKGLSAECVRSCQEAIHLGTRLFLTWTISRALARTG
ncbi:unnamed protein product [Prorocentrum cordatum]|uniref:beta-glucosidase n=1 Tax=Prorocentrum cordatum TaxID=2364126 RepID=A0ABN9RA76_9DINO|nr:unnamed protein product [Polarella glacialis]